MARALAVFAALLAFAVTFVGASSASEETSFKGSLEGTVTVTPINPPIASVLVEATGNATKLGRFTVEVPHVVNQAARVGAGSYIFTAANGDTLTASFTGVGTLVAPGVLSTTETATITGGTGRFAGATGSFTSHRTFFITAGETVGSFEGTISSPSKG